MSHPGIGRPRRREPHRVQPKRKSTAARPCDRCHTHAPRLFRIRTDERPAWHLVCRPCCEALQPAGGYRYGGTWTNRARS